jgi:transcriptional regulator with XRE-family HTH domain
MDWPQALKSYRLRHALTQAALAEILNVDPTTVSRWERGRDRPALGIQRRLRSLLIPPASGLERILKDLIDASGTIAVLYDAKYRVVCSSRRHRELLRLDASELYGQPFQKFEPQAQATFMQSVGGIRGWLRNGIASVDCTLIRHPFEKARNPEAFAQRASAWTIREGLESPLILGISREMPLSAYQPHFAFTTLDDPCEEGAP